MAINLRAFRKLNINLASNVLFKSNFINVGVRCIYAEKDLGVTAYEGARFVFRNQFMTIEDTFRNKMKEICAQEDGVIYTEDLKAMIHLARENDEDMDLIHKMHEKYIKSRENSATKYGTYVFGPVVMRMYYYLNQPKWALAMFENEIFSSSFDYHSTFRVFMCLLFKNDMFKEFRDVYDKVLSTKGIEFIGSSSVLMYAACMKENSPEALKYAIGQWKVQLDKFKPALRSCSLLSYLAIKNKSPETAVEILTLVDKETAVSIRCLKVLAFMHLGRYIQIIPILKRALEQDQTGFRRQHFFADVIYELEDNVKTSDVAECQELLNMIVQLKDNGLLDTNMTLGEFLMRPMVTSMYSKIRNKNVNKNNNRIGYNTKPQVKAEFSNYL